MKITGNQRREQRSIFDGLNLKCFFSKARIKLKPYSEASKQRISAVAVVGIWLSSSSKKVDIYKVYINPKNYV